MDRYRSGAYAQANPDWHDADGRTKALAVLDWVQELRPGSVIDVGCGTGAVLEALAAALDLQETVFEGWDIAPRAIAKAQTRTRPGLSFILGDPLERGRTADLALVLDVIEHLPDDAAFLRALHAVAPRAILRFPLDLSVLDLARPGRLQAARGALGHLHVYTRELAQELLARTGWVVEHSRYHRVPPAVSGPRARIVDGLRQLVVAIAPDTGVRWLGGYSWLVSARGA